MKGTIRAAFVVLAWCTAATAHAEYQPNSRDGCPPGSVEVLKDVAYPTAASAPRYAGVEERQTGAVGQFDSALVPTRLILGTSYTHFGPANAAQRARIWSEDVQLHVNGDPANWRPYGHDNWSIGGSVMWSHAGVLPGDGTATSANPAPSRSGNLVLALAVRGHGVTSKIEDDSVQLAGLRHAWAAQLIGALPPEAENPRQALQALSLLQLFPYDSYRYAPHWALGISFEWRMEAVGCYAPFVHFRVGGVLNPNLDAMTGRTQNDMVLAPQSLAVGFYPTTGLAALFQYSVLVYYSPAEPRRTDPLIGTNAVHRFRFAVEKPWGPITLSAQLDLFRGATQYDGTVLGVFIATGPLANRSLQ